MRSNHVWAADITYIPMQRGFIQPAAQVEADGACLSCLGSGEVAEEGSIDVHPERIIFEAEPSQTAHLRYYHFLFGLVRGDGIHVRNYFRRLVSLAEQGMFSCGEHHRCCP